jgi:hypothetical protein
MTAFALCFARNDGFRGTRRVDTRRSRLRVARLEDWIPRLRSAPRGMTANLRSSAKSAVHSVNESLIETEQDRNRRDARILADQVEGRGEERPQSDAPGSQRLMDGNGDTNDVTQALPVFASRRLCVRFSSSVDNHEPRPFRATQAGQSAVWCDCGGGFRDCALLRAE